MHPRRFFNPFHSQVGVSRVRTLGVQHSQGEQVRIRQTVAARARARARAGARAGLGVLGACVLATVLVSPAQASTNNIPVVVVQALADVIIIPDVPPIAPAGPVSFPLNFTVNTPTADLGLTASRLVVPAPVEGCTRVVSSLTTAFTVQAEAPVQIQFSILGSGPPIELVPGTTSSYVGDGIELPFDPMMGLVLVGLEPSPTTQAGTATITFATPRDYRDVVGGFGVISGLLEGTPPTNWTLESATYDVTDSCPDPVVAAPAALAATGTGDAPVGLAGTALLVVGALVMAMSRRLRLEHPLK